MRMLTLKTSFKSAACRFFFKNGGKHLKLSRFRRRVAWETSKSFLLGGVCSGVRRGILFEGSGLPMCGRGHTKMCAWLSKAEKSFSFKVRSYQKLVFNPRRMVLQVAQSSLFLSYNAMGFPSSICFSL